MNHFAQVLVARSSSLYTVYQAGPRVNSFRTHNKPFFLLRISLNTLNFDCFLRNFPVLNRKLFFLSRSSRLARLRSAPPTWHWFAVARQNLQITSGFFSSERQLFRWKTEVCFFLRFVAFIKVQWPTGLPPTCWRSLFLAASQFFSSRRVNTFIPRVWEKVFSRT